jgi:hypothetical protein
MLGGVQCETYAPMPTGTPLSSAITSKSVEVPARNTKSSDTNFERI